MESRILESGGLATPETDGSVHSPLGKTRRVLLRVDSSDYALCSEPRSAREIIEYQLKHLQSSMHESVQSLTQLHGTQCTLLWSRWADAVNAWYTRADPTVPILFHVADHECPLAREIMLCTVESSFHALPASLRSTERYSLDPASNLTQSPNSTSILADKRQLAAQLEHQQRMGTTNLCFRCSMIQEQDENQIQIRLSTLFDRNEWASFFARVLDVVDDAQTPLSIAKRKLGSKKTPTLYSVVSSIAALRLQSAQVHSHSV